VQRPPGPHPGFGQPGQPYPGQPYPGQPYPGQPYPGQGYTGQPYPGQRDPGFVGQQRYQPRNQNPYGFDARGQKPDPNQPPPNPYDEMRFRR